VSTSVANGAGRHDPTAEISQSSASHLRDFGVATFIGAAVGRLGAGQVALFF
jgi:hypothetical protein